MSASHSLNLHGAVCLHSAAHRTFHYNMEMSGRHVVCVVPMRDGVLHAWYACGRVCQVELERALIYGAPKISGRSELLLI